MFYRWWRIDKEDRTQLWLLYGWFAGLMCIGSMFGVVEWVAWMKYMELLYVLTFESKALEQAAAAQQAIWQARSVVAHAVEFMCLSVAKLMVLDRIKQFAAPKTTDRAIRWEVLGRGVMAIVVVGNVVGAIANISAAVLFKETADLNTAASAAYAINNDTEGKYLNRSANQKYQQSVIANSVQLFCEVSCLLVIISAFAVVGVAGAQRVRLGLRDVKDEKVLAAGMQVRRQILGTAGFIFLTFLLRAVYSIMYAFALAFANNNDDCVANIVDQCDGTCFNVWAIIQAWIYFTPEFPLSVEFISSPVALLVALWGMTSHRTLRLMRRATRSNEASMSLGAGLISSRGTL